MGDEKTKAVDDSRVKSRQLFLEKREKQQIDLYKKRLDDEEILF